MPNITDDAVLASAQYVARVLTNDPFEGPSPDRIANLVCLFHSELVFRLTNADNLDSVLATTNNLLANAYNQED